MAWFQRRWYVERPFPWLLISLYAAPILLVVGALITMEVMK